LSTFNQCRTEYLIDSKFGFNRFLTILEIFFYYLSVYLGIYCVYKVQTDQRVTQEPFAMEPEVLEMH